MSESSDLYKKSISNAFMSLPNTNTSTMMDSMKYQNMVKEEGDEEEVSEKWTQKYKDSIDCKHPKGFSQKAHCQGKRKKSENKEATGSGGGVGAYEGPLFSNMKEDEDEDIKKIEATEATGSGSVGAYSTPAAWAKSENKKDWRGKSKTQIPGGSFVSVKKKCKKFPYCNQGDINALNIFQNENLKEAISEVAKRFNLNENVIKAILDYEYEKVNKNK